MPIELHCNVQTASDTTRVMPKTEPWVTFGAWIKGKRESEKLSQGGAADRAGIDRQQWFRIENGLSGTRRETVIKMARALSANENEALNRAGFATPEEKPQNLQELLAALDKLGVGVNFSGMEQLRDDPEALQQVLDHLRISVRVMLEEQNK